MASLQLSKAEATEKGQLPSCCMLCGATSVVFVTREFTQPEGRVQGSGSTIGGVVEAIDAVSKLFRGPPPKMSVRLPLCGRHRTTHWQDYLPHIGFGIMSLGVVILLLGTSGTLSFVLCGVFLAVGLGILVVALFVSAGQVRAGRVEEERITLENVSPKFIEALTAHRQAAQER
jgi:hypothetical protein